MTICLFKSKKFSQLGKYNLINWDEGKFKAMVNGDNGNVTTVPDIMYPDQYWEVIGQNLSVMKTILVNTIRTGPIQWYVCDTCLSPRFFFWFEGYHKIICHTQILNLAEEHNNVSCDLDDLVLQSHIWHLKIISWIFLLFIWLRLHCSVLNRVSEGLELFTIVIM